MHPIQHIKSDIPDHAFPVLYSLALWELPITQNRLHEFLLSALNNLNIGTNYSVASIKTSLADLISSGSVHFLAGSGYQIAPEVGHAVLLHLHEHHQLRAWITQVRDFLSKNREYSSWSTPSSAFCQREMLFAAFNDDLAQLGHWRAQFFAFPNTFDTLPAQKLFATPAGALLFDHLKPNLQGILLFDLFSAASWMLEKCTAAYDYAKQHASDRFGKDGMLMEALSIQALLRGDPEPLQQVHDAFPLAIKALMKADFFNSAEIFNRILTERKSKTNKRKLFVPDLPGLFYTVSLLTSPGAQALKSAKEQCDDGCKMRQAQFYPAIKSLVEHLKNGTPLEVKQAALQYQSLDDFFVRLACFWQDVVPTESDRRHLKNLFALCQRHGYAWVAAEIAQLYLQQFQESIDPGAGFDDWHAAHGLHPLYAALQRQETWQRALSALSQLKTVATSGADSRIAWFIECESHFVNLEPREQKRNAKGIWSKGRPIALKRLSYDQDSLPGISEQDKKVASCIKKSYDNYYGASDYEINGEKALPFLISHPHVYWLDAPDVRIDISRGEPALVMQQQGDKIHMQLEPAMHVDDGVIWRKQTPTRLVVYPGSAEIRQIAGIIGKGLSVPANAKSQLVDVIAAIAPHLNIHSDLPELAQHISRIEADEKMYAHLLPLKDGLRVQFLVRPLPEGSWFTPGKGSANVVGEHQGSAVQTTRNLAQEQQLLDTLLNHCHALNQAEQQGQEWELDHPELCLELLSELNELKLTLTEGLKSRLELVWPEGERFRIKSTGSLAQLHLSIKKQGDWFVAGGELQLNDGKVLALRELLQMVNGANGRFLPLGDNQFLALTESFKKRLLELNALSDSVGKDGVRVSQLASGLLAELADEVGDLEADAAWQTQLQKLSALADYQPQLPSTLQATLRDYQLEGYQWLSRLAYWGVGACLADDMGLGKTVQTLAVLLERAPRGPALVVAPISVAMNWQAETARFAPTLKVRAYHQNRTLEDLGPFDLVVASYGMLQQDDAAFAQIDWHTVVLDEAQVIKNAATKRSQAAMALKAEFRIIASGTPVENHLGELWNLFRFINPGLLGSKERFTERFATPIERGDKQARSHLKKLIQPFILRRTKTQVLSELPARTEITLQVELSDQERHLYEALRLEALDKIEHMSPEQGKSMQVLAEITKLRRFCCHPQLVMKQTDVSGSKLAVFAETLEELLDNNHKALVFSQFVDHLAIVRAWLEEKGISYQYLDGSTLPAQRRQRVEAFQSGQGDVFLISLKAGGTGLNLTAADYVIHLDPWWNPAVEDQASDRAHRMGQLRPVTIYRLVTKQTIEEKIIALHAQKRDLADSLLEGGDVSAKLDTAALLRLLKDSA